MLHQLARRLRATVRSTEPRSRRKGLLQGFRRLRLESLESRIALANFYVTTTADIVAADGQTSLREAIRDANLTSAQDTIWLKSGTYRIGPANAAAGEDLNASGDFDIRNDLIIRGISASATRVDARGLDRVFDIHALANNVTFENLTIKGGLTNEDGGGIRQNESGPGDILNLTLKNTIVTGNVATGDGGGVYHYDGLVTLNNSKVTLNRAIDGSGGGVDSAYGDITAKWSTISKNNAGADGGGLSAYSNVTLENTTVSGNVSREGKGGGVYCDFGNVIVRKSTVSKNIALESGGGIYANRDVDLEDSTVTGNISRDGNGGGVYSYFGSVDADWSSVKANRALGTESDGGGIWAKLDVDLKCSTVSGNVAKDVGGGIKSSTASVYLEDSKILDNVATNSGGGIFADVNVKILCSTVSGNTSTDGSGGGIYSEFGYVDVRESKVEDNTAYGGGGGIWAASTVSDYDVIVHKSTVSGNTSTDASGGGVGTSGNFKITESKILDNYAFRNGGGAYGAAISDNFLEKSTVSGNTSGGHGGGIFAGGNLTVHKSTISDNSAVDYGGGIYDFLGLTTLTESIVSGNFAAWGGGVFAYELDVKKSTIDDNAATDYGGGIHVTSGAFNLEQTTVSNNRAGADGGGIFVNLAVSGATLTNSTISGNTATRNGGGIYFAGGSSSSLLHLTITQNIADSGGGAFAAGGSTVNVRNTIIAQNFLIAGPSTDGPDVFGIFNETSGSLQGHNLIGINDGAAASFPASIPPGTPNVNGSFVGTSVTPQDPRLGALENNGGPTETHALLSGSKAINTALPGVGVDQRGVSRPQLGGHDIGAFERRGSWDT